MIKNFFFLDRIKKILSNFREISEIRMRDFINFIIDSKFSYYNKPHLFSLNVLHLLYYKLTKRVFIFSRFITLAIFFQPFATCSKQLKKKKLFLIKKTNIAQVLQFKGESLSRVYNFHGTLSCIKFHCLGNNQFFPWLSGSFIAFRAPTRCYILCTQLELIVVLHVYVVVSSPPRTSRQLGSRNKILCTDAALDQTYYIKHIFRCARSHVFWLLGNRLIFRSIVRKSGGFAIKVFNRCCCSCFLYLFSCSLKILLT